jgi:hypothetical protein
MKVIDFYESPASVDKVYDEGWKNVFAIEGTEAEGYEEFCRFIFNFMNDICSFYKEYGQKKGHGKGFELSKGVLTERNYMTLWNVFFLVFM